MARDASELAHCLAREAEAVCRYYLSNGRRQGRYWLVGDVHNTPGRSMFVRLQDSPKGPAGKWTDAATGEHGDLLDILTSAPSPRRQDAFSSYPGLNRKVPQNRLAPSPRLAHKRPQDGCLRSQVRLRVPSLRLICTVAE
jgi:hypothetical protein